MNSFLRVATYSRVSTSHHDQNPDVQVQELKRYCAARGWEIVEEIVDHGYSGSNDNRPGLKRLLSLVRSREVQGVVVLKMDRLFRSLKHMVASLEEFQALGATFVAVKDSIDYSTPTGRLFAQVLASLSEFERALVRERTILGLAHAKAQGKQLGRPRTGPSKEEVMILRDQGQSFRSIASKLRTSIGSVHRAAMS